MEALFKNVQRERNWECHWEQFTVDRLEREEEWRRVFGRSHSFQGGREGRSTVANRGSRGIEN